MSCCTLTLKLPLLQASMEKSKLPSGTIVARGMLCTKQLPTPVKVAITHAPSARLYERELLETLYPKNPSSLPNQPMPDHARAWVAAHWGTPPQLRVTGSLSGIDSRKLLISTRVLLP